MADQFYADPSVVTIGAKFSTNFRFFRQAIVTPVVTYVQVGPTMNVESIGGARGMAYSCGPWQIRNRISPTSAFAAYPVNTITSVAF